MKRFFVHVAIACAFAAAFQGRAAQFKFPHHTITVPDGFEVELVTTTDLVPRPIEADFDEQGRLYVTDSSGSNDKVEKQLAEKPHRVVRLEDTDGDGRFDKSIVFADKMMFPEGALWFDGSLYVSAPPSIWKLTDTNNDGVADVRVEWFQGKTLTGCANDLHGPYLGPDGWIYWCKGAFAKQTHRLANGKELVTRASHIFRARPDGSGLESVLTGGMDNPVGLAFTPEGERLLSGTFFLHPEAGKRDGLIHAIYGGVYGKSHDVLDDHPRTGDLMPIMTHTGPSAPVGMIRYESRVFGDEFENNLFACHFNLKKITRHVLERDGATYRTRDEDFLVSDNTDFHPTDVIEDADGSLLVIDTGGWYKLCCPTSQLQKPDVLGAIYRVRRQGAPKVADARGLRIDWQARSSATLAKRLDDPRPAVQQRAIGELAKRPGQSTLDLLRATLDQSDSITARRNAVWVISRLGTPALPLLNFARTDQDESVAHAALTVASAWRWEFSGNVTPPGAKPAPALVRAHVEWLGRRPPHASTAAELLKIAEASAARMDRVLEHSLTYALMECADVPATRLALRSPSDRVRRIALIALDQMNPGELKPGEVIPLLTSTNRLLKETAGWIASRHTDWAGPLAGYFAQRLANENLNDAERNEIQQQLSGFARHSSVQDLLARVVADHRGPLENRRAALQAMASARLKTTPTNWNSAVAEALGATDPKLKQAAVTAARSLSHHGADLAHALRELADRDSTPVDLRLSAFAASKTLDRLSPAGFGFLVSQLAPANSVNARITAADVLLRARLSPDQLNALTGAVTNAGPLELPKLIAVFGRSRSEEIGLKLLDALRAAPAVASLHPSTVRPHFTNFPAVVQQRADELFASLNQDAVQQNAELDRLLGVVKNGDIRRGQALFNSDRTACASCHAIGYLGGNIGPDLTRIGQIRTERDLLEALVYPNASFVRSYEPMIVSTKDGEEFSGVLRKDAPEEVVLATGPASEARIARADIAEMRPGSVSVMPGGLVEQLTPQELADLVAFLRATRW